MSLIPQNLVVTALLGTDKGMPDIAELDDDLAALVGGLDIAEREKFVLGAAAATSLYHRAGSLPEKDTEPLPEPAPTDDLPVCNARATQALHKVLSKEFNEFLLEWLQLAAGAGQRVPDELLPEVLNYGTRGGAIEYADAIKAVIGKRGHWLAQFSPQWEYARETITESAWENSVAIARRIYLRQLRLSDAAAANTLLQQSWKGESVAFQRQVMRDIAETLRPEDEPFLEYALTHSPDDIEQLAAEMLGSLSGSAYVARLIKLVTPLLTIGMEKGKDALILQSIPDSVPEKELKRDRIQQSSRIQSAALALKAIPLSHWEKHFAKSPAELIELARRSEQVESIFQAWQEATIRYANSSWASAFFNHVEAHYGEKTTDAAEEASPFNLYADIYRQGYQRLCALLSAVRREEVFTKFMQRAEYDWQTLSALFALLQICDHTWSVEFQTAIVNFLQKINHANIAAPARPQLELMARHFDYNNPSPLNFALAQSNKRNYEWIDARDYLQRALDFRRELHAIFRAT
jgi:hypothetical protein